ncbi:MAG: RnfABCDGE type electron transport complex subunit G [Spirochaetota bacterium]
MSNRARMILILTLFACVSGGVLSLVYLFSAPLIQANMEAEQQRAVFQVVPGAEDYEERQAAEVTFYRCTDGSGTLVGYALPAQGNGYQGVIRLMIGLTPGLERITGLEVLEQVETPGLGGRISEMQFKEQFAGVETEPEVAYVKNQEPDDPNEIQAVTGATISSRSVVTIINRAVERFEQVKEGGS